MAGWLALFWSYYWLLTQVITALEFSAVTGRVNLQDAIGQMAAFADFNADKATDILVLNSTGPMEARNPPQFILSCVYRFHSRPLSVEYQRGKILLDDPDPVSHTPYCPSHIMANHCRDTQSSVLAVQVGDFDGDGLVDLVTLTNDGGRCASARIHWIALREGLPEVAGKV